MLNGSSQYVTMGAAPALGSPNFTLELWFRRTGAGVGVSTGGDGIANAIPLVTKGRSESGVDMNYFFGIDASTGMLVADFEDTADAANHPVTGTTVVTSNVWHHAAAVYDTATDTWRLYLDGNLDRTLALGGDFTPAAPSPSHSAIGSALTSTGVAAGFFQGAVDEVRDLERRADHGADPGDRRPRAHLGQRAGRPLRAERGHRHVGHLQRRRRAQRLARRRRRPGRPVRRSRLDITPPAAPTGLTATGAVGSIGLGWTASAAGDLAGYNVYRATTTPVPTNGTPLNGATPLATSRPTRTRPPRRARPTTTWSRPRTSPTTSRRPPRAPRRRPPAVAAGQAVLLNGTSQYVTFGAAPALNASNLTVELWFRRTGAGTGTSTGTGGIASAIPLVTKGRAEAETPANLNMDYFLGIDASTGTLVADFEDTANGTNHPVAGTTVVTSNVWHHAAAIYDTATDTWRLYLDGVLDRTLALGGNFTPESTSIQHAAIGSALTSNGTAAGFFQGAVDEVRIWNVARSEAQIQAARTLELTSGTGLIGRYGLNEGSGTTAASSVAGAPTGTLDRPARPGRAGAPFGGGGAERRADGRAQRAGRRRRRARRRRSRSRRRAPTPTPRPLTVTFFGRVAQSGNFTQIATFPGVAPGTAQTTAWTPLETGLRYEWYATVSDGTTTADERDPHVQHGRGPDPVLVGAGDIADCNSTGDEATGALIAGIAGGVYTTGDNVYANGTAAEFANCYEPTGWGGAVEGPHAAGAGQPRLEHRQPQRLLRPLRRAGRRHRDRRRTTPTTSARTGMSSCSTATAAASPAAARVGSPQHSSSSTTWRPTPRATSSRCGTTRASARRSTNADRRAAVRRRPATRRTPTSSSSATTTSTSASRCSGRPARPTRTACATSRSAPAARATTRSAPSGPAARSATSPPTACCGSCCTRRATTGSSSPSPASRFTDSGTQAIVGGNAPPSATVALTPTTAGTNDVLTATATKSDPETDPVSLTWEWRVNGVLRRTFTSGERARRHVRPVRRAGNGDAGDTVAVTVTPSDAAHAGTPVSASLVDQRDEPGAGVHDRPDRPDPGRGRQRLARRRRDRPRGQRPDLQRDAACPRASRSIRAPASSAAC